MKSNGSYIGPVTGHEYMPGERIDIKAEGIGCTGEKGSPDAVVDGRTVYKRIFIRLRRPDEVLTFRPITDGEDFARRVAVIEQWYNNVEKEYDDWLLTFEAVPMTPEILAELEQEGGAR